MALNLCLAVTIGLLSVSKVIVFAVLVKYLTLKLFLGKKTPIIPIILMSLVGLPVLLTIYGVTTHSNVSADLITSAKVIFELAYYSSTFLYILIFERVDFRWRHITQN